MGRGAVVNYPALKGEVSRGESDEWAIQNVPAVCARVPLLLVGGLLRVQLKATPENDWALAAVLAGGVRLMKLLELMIKGLVLDDLYLEIDHLSKPVDHPYTLEVCNFYADANRERILELELELYGCLDSDL